MILWFLASKQGTKQKKTNEFFETSLCVCTSWSIFNSYWPKSMSPIACLVVLDPCFSTFSHHPNRVQKRNYEKRLPFLYSKLYSFACPRTILSDNITLCIYFGKWTRTRTLILIYKWCGCYLCRQSLNVDKGLAEQRSKCFAWLGWLAQPRFLFLARCLLRQFQLLCAFSVCFSSYYPRSFFGTKTPMSYTVAFFLISFILIVKMLVSNGFV